MNRDAMVAVQDGQVAGFEDREKFIRGRAGDLLAIGREQICNVLVETNASLVTDPSKVGFPWLSPIIGSGATGDLNEIAEVTVSAETAVSSLDDYADRIDAARFAEVLIKQRVAGVAVSIDPVRSADPSVDEPDLTGLLLLAASRLTRAYHRFRSLEPSVLGRSADATARLADSAINVEVIGEYMQPTLQAMKSLQSACHPADTRTRLGLIRDRAARVLSQAIPALESSTEGRFEIRIADVTALTELTWYSLSEPLYPEWSDLLWGLFAEGPNWPPSEHHGPRPLLQGHENAVEEIGRKYRKRTVHSWASRSGGGQPRDHVYDAAAQVLAAQAHFRTSWVKSHGTGALPPVASAYVTTFDLELEIALLALRQDFVMAVPVTATWVDRKQGPVNGIVWIGCVVSAAVESDPDLGGLMSPAPEAWFLLSNVPDYERIPRTCAPDVRVGADDPDQLISFLPIVVRLAGAPLVTCPEINAAGRLRDGFDSLLGSVEVTDLSHAILLDEYVGLDHVEAILRRIAPAPEHGGGKYYELPAEISAANLEHGYSRYWVMLGVQFGDAAIRSVIGVQLALPRGKTGRSYQLPKRNGVAIQGDQQTSGEAEDLIRRIGLDIVRSPLAQFLPDLRHYAAHVRTADAKLPMPEEFLPWNVEIEAGQEDARKPLNLIELPSQARTTCRLGTESTSQ